MDERDTLGAVLDDAEKVFRYVQGERPQDRAHAYLKRRRIARGFDDTAMLCVVNDLIRRAHAVGVADSATDDDGFRKTFLGFRDELLDNEYCLHLVLCESLHMQHAVGRLMLGACYALADLGKRLPAETRERMSAEWDESKRRFAEADSYAKELERFMEEAGNGADKA